MQEKFIVPDEVYNRVSMVVFTLLLLVLTSPGFSVLGSFIGIFIPNARISLAMIVCFLPKDKFSLTVEYIRILYVSLIMASIVMLRFTVYPSDRIAETSDAGLIIFLVTLPIFINFFSKNKRYLFTSLLIVIYLQISLAIFQSVAMSLGMYDTALSFNNYHKLHGLIYLYPKVSGIFYRTAGLFIESSQYSVFLCFCYVYMSRVITIDNKLKRIANFTKIIILIAVLINSSITGYLTIISIFIINLKQNLKMLAFLLPIFIMVLYLSGTNMSELSDTNDSLSQKLTANTTGYSKGSNDAESERSGAFFNNIETSLLNRPVLGYGDLKEEVNRWDFVSTYLYGYGVPGFIIMSVTIIFILKGAPIEYSISLLLALTTNGNLQGSIYLVILPIIILSKDNGRKHIL